MRLPVSYAALGSALGLALAAGGTAAHAQTIITPAVVDQPVVTVPAATVVQPETVQTTETIRTVPATPQPLYDEVAPAPVATTPQPLYDEVAAPMAPATLAAPPLVSTAPAVASEPYTYRYVYQPDRILVVDPVTGIAVQSIPR